MYVWFVFRCSQKADFVFQFSRNLLNALSDKEQQKSVQGMIIKNGSRDNLDLDTENYYITKVLSSSSNACLKPCVCMFVENYFTK